MPAPPSLLLAALLDEVRQDVHRVLAESVVVPPAVVDAVDQAGPQEYRYVVRDVGLVGLELAHHVAYGEGAPAEVLQDLHAARIRERFADLGYPLGVRIHHHARMSNFGEYKFILNAWPYKRWIIMHPTFLMRYDNRPPSDPLHPEPRAQEILDLRRAVLLRQDGSGVVGEHDVERGVPLQHPRDGAVGVLHLALRRGDADGVLAEHVRDRPGEHLLGALGVLRSSQSPDVGVRQDEPPRREEHEHVPQAEEDPEERADQRPDGDGGPQPRADPPLDPLDRAVVVPVLRRGVRRHDPVRGRHRPTIL